MSSVTGYICGASGLNVAVNGKVHNFPKNHLNYEKALEEVRQNCFENIEELHDVSASITNTFCDNIKIVNGAVYYQGRELHGVLVNTIIDYVKCGHNVNHLLLFLSNLMQNPSKHSVDTLYPFLEKHGLVITEDGCFLAYKKVDNDYMDYYTNTFDNHVGNSVPACEPLDRNSIDDDVNVGCSQGLHVGSRNYAEHQYHSGQGRLLLVKVNPADVVCVPRDCEYQKIRVTQYFVVSECCSSNGSCDCEY